MVGVTCTPTSLVRSIRSCPRDRNGPDADLSSQFRQALTLILTLTIVPNSIRLGRGKRVVVVGRSGVRRAVSLVVAVSALCGLLSAEAPAAGAEDDEWVLRHSVGDLNAGIFSERSQRFAGRRSHLDG